MYIIYFENSDGVESSVIVKAYALESVKKRITDSGLFVTSVGKA